MPNLNDLCEAVQVGQNIDLMYFDIDACRYLLGNDRFGDGFIQESKRIKFIISRDGEEAALAFAKQVICSYHEALNMRPGANPGSKISNYLLTGAARQHTLGSICFFEIFIDFQEDVL